MVLDWAIASPWSTMVAPANRPTAIAKEIPMRFMVRSPVRYSTTKRTVTPSVKVRVPPTMSSMTDVALIDAE